MNAVEKYLNNETAYSEIEGTVLADFPAGLQRGLVIPAYRESLPKLLSLCEFCAQHPGTLLVLVLNRPATTVQAEDTYWAQALLNHPLLSEPYWQNNTHHLSAYRLGNKNSLAASSLLVADRCVSGPPLDADQGVGLARKIGSDILCHLIADGKLLSPWIWQSDADATLPDSYFIALEKVDTTATKTAAAIYPFFHQINKADGNTALATLLYEFSLHYYVAGLRWAASPYAYHTLGSTLAIHYQHYAQVRGFPKRAGAEDFYILNKLAKTGSIVSLTAPFIELQARQSNRVPFGTGPAVTKLAASENPIAMPLYHPSCFAYLQLMLRLIESLATDGSHSIAQQLEQLFAKAQDATTLDENLLRQAANSIGLEKAWHHCHQHGSTQAARQQHLQHWFDGFKTLKFIHRIRDSLPRGTIRYSEWRQYLPDNFPNSAELLDLDGKLRNILYE